MVMNKNLNFQYMLDSKEFYSWIPCGQVKKRGRGGGEKGEGRGRGREIIPKNKPEKCSRYLSGRPFFNSLDKPLTIHY